MAYYNRQNDMIKINLEKVAQDIGKSITDIAEETGLNRNTITALYHNKVDGIKFETLEKLCSTYRLALTDILQMSTSAEKQVSVEPQKFYRQEGALIPFTCWPWSVVVNGHATDFFDVGFGRLKLYYKGSYGWVYWDHDALYRLAEHVYHRYGKSGRINEAYAKFLTHKEPIESLYREADLLELVQLSDVELVAYFNTLWVACRGFWQYSLFIDSFDPGFDQEEITRIAEKHGLSKEEVGVLTTPTNLTFTNERLLQLLEIIRPLFRKKLGKDQLKSFVTQYVQEDPGIRKHIRDYDYYKSNYAFIRHVTNEEVIAEIEKYLLDKDLFDSDYDRLKHYRDQQERAIKNIRTKHSLKENPLQFFNLLTYWREERKQVNLMSIYVYHMILQVIEEKTGVPKKYLEYLSYEEVEVAIKGLISKATLEKRLENGILVEYTGTTYRMIEGEEAVSLRDELEKKLLGEQDQKSITGQTACQGYAKGIARVILDENDFQKLKKGEILVTGMTRPEFVPLMKVAAGIVTNEGGITCHAAIVSRELGKPCIIGTKIGTEVIKDGDLIEVRANHGTVRILS